MLFLGLQILFVMNFSKIACHLCNVQEDCVTVKRIKDFSLRKSFIAMNDLNYCTSNSSMLFSSKSRVSESKHIEIICFGIQKPVITGSWISPAQPIGSRESLYKRCLLDIFQQNPNGLIGYKTLVLYWHHIEMYSWICFSSKNCLFL